MGDESVTRKLTAIIHADVAGYSRLMSEDEEATVQTLSAYRELISDLVGRHKGRIVDMESDSVLAEFRSVLDAAKCAVKAQNTIKEKNVDLPKDRKMQFRIGINLGDVIEEKDRIYGDGINVAARIEKLADPGGICISGMVYTQIRSKLNLDFQDMGKQEVKNVPNPVRVYRILLETPIAKSLNEVGASLPEKPSIAVLPFDNMSSDPEQEYFSEGISEDILNGLAKNRNVDVIARTSAFSFKGKNQDIRDIGEQLNATHILEGSVRKFRSRIRVTAQLISTDTGMHIWSEQYNSELTDVFEIQDEIAGAILRELNIRLLDSRQEQAQTGNLAAYDAYLWGRYYALRPMDFPKAIDSLNKAVSLDPDYADAHGMLAQAHNYDVWWFSFPASEKLPIVLKHIGAALDINPHQPHALCQKAWLRLSVDHAHQDAIDIVFDLMHRHPNDSNIQIFASGIMRAIGCLDLALEIIERSLEIDPFEPRVYMHRGEIFHAQGRFHEAMQSYERMEDLGLRSATLLSLSAFDLGDAEKLRDQLDRGQDYWKRDTNWHLTFKAAAFHLEDDMERAAKTLKLFENRKGYLPYYLRSVNSLLMGNRALSIENLANALSEKEYSAYLTIQHPMFYLRLFPDYRSHPEYEKMLRDVGLDKESVAKLKIPPLPF